MLFSTGRERRRHEESFRRQVVSKRWTLSECFNAFGAVGSNPRWSWSARSSDGGTVVITLWKDRIVFKGGTVFYEDVKIDTEAWRDRPGNRERIANLIWAREHCNGFFKTVITIAKDERRQPREIRECFPKPEYNMRILSLNEGTGEFVACHQHLAK